MMGSNPSDQREQPGQASLWRRCGAGDVREVRRDEQVHFQHGSKGALHPWVEKRFNQWAGAQDLNRA